MKLNTIPARTGLTWVKLGVLTFFRQPLALAGLFFMFMATSIVVSFVPVLGSIVTLVLLPGLTLGLMEATRIANEGKFPMPAALVTAYRGDRIRAKAMLILGGMYAVGFCVIAALVSLIDGGALANMYLLGGKINEEMVLSSDFQTAGLLFMALYLPLSMAFWHAPALVYWQGMSPGKSLFFSLVACWRSKSAYLFYSLAWMAVWISILMLVGLVATLMGAAGAMGAVLMPISLILMSMFFTSLYYTYRDTFASDAATPDTNDPSTLQEESQP